ncbi:MAG: type II secretion system protein [Symploca sp. SIO2E6]|nr:type II secretion system protein [Symploca sp. SIO2E6]
MKPSLNSSQSGFTIIESLVAIIVVAILLAGVAPLLVFSTATRVQSRRVELASQAASSYISGMQSGAIKLHPPEGIEAQLKDEPAPIIGNLADCTTANYYCQAAPTGPNNTATTQLFCIDNDGGGCTEDSTSDMIIQAYRQPNSDTGDGYPIGVRVYRADAFANGALVIGRQQSTVTSGLGDRNAPVVEMTAEIPGANGQTNFGALCDRLGGCGRP